MTNFKDSMTPVQAAFVAAFVTTSEAARMLGTTRRNVYEQIADGKLPGTVKVGLQRLIPRTAVEEILQPKQLSSPRTSDPSTTAPEPGPSHQQATHENSLCLVNEVQRKLHHGQCWGDWHLDAERLTLDYKPDGIWRYEVDLERVYDSASLLDYIFQVHGHSFHLQWPSDVMQDLLDALDEIFQPQSNLCSVGMDKRLPAGFLHKRIETREARQ
jgi:excisionase family DNA binding protein